MDGDVQEKFHNKNTISKELYYKKIDKGKKSVP